MARTFSSTKLRQPSLGTKQAIFLPFLISWTRTHLRIAELGCLASMPLPGAGESACQQPHVAPHAARMRSETVQRRRRLVAEAALIATLGSRQTAAAVQRPRGARRAVRVGGVATGAHIFSSTMPFE